MKIDRKLVCLSVCPGNRNLTFVTGTLFLVSRDWYFVYIRHISQTEVESEEIMQIHLLDLDFRFEL